MAATALLVLAGAALASAGGCGNARGSDRPILQEKPGARYPADAPVTAPAPERSGN